MRRTIPSDHFAFAEDVQRIPGKTACGLLAVATTDDYWRTDVTEDWVTDIAEPVDPKDILCDLCRSALSAAIDEVVA